MSLSIFRNKAILTFLVENKWIIFAAVFFLLWKFFLVATLWDGRTQPPEWDDSYGYIDHIYSVVSCPSLLFCQDTPYNFRVYAGFDHLTYRFFWGGLARLLNVDAMTIFQWSFYIGIPMLIAAVIFFLKRLTDNKNITAFTLFVLAFYNGAGSYHGFYWVVPSFFAVVLLLILLGLIIDPKKQPRQWVPWILLIVPLAIFTHIVGLYAILLMFPALFVIKSTLTLKIDWLMLKKVALAVFVAAVFYLPVYFKVSRNIPYGLTSVVREVGRGQNIPSLTSQEILPAIFEVNVYKEFSLINLFPSSGRFYFDYLKWVFPHWLAIFIFAGVLGLLFIKKEYAVLSLYGAALVFVLIATLNQFGFRTLAVLWPATFLVYAFGAWSAFSLIRGWSLRSLRYAGFATLSLFIAGFIGLNAAYSLYWAETENRKKDFHITNEAVNFIYSHQGQSILLDTLIPIYLRNKNYQPVLQAESLAGANFLCTVELSERPTPLSKASILFRDNFTSYTGGDSQLETGEIPKHFSVEETFDGVNCYRNTERT